MQPGPDPDPWKCPSRSSFTSVDRPIGIQAIEEAIDQHRDNFGSLPARPAERLGSLSGVAAFWMVQIPMKGRGKEHRSYDEKSRSLSH